MARSGKRTLSLPAVLVAAGFLSCASAWCAPADNTASQYRPTFGSTNAGVVVLQSVDGSTSVPVDPTHPLSVTGTVTTSAGVTVVTTTDKAGTVTTGGTAQVAIAANASRKGWCIQNPATATEVLTIRLNGTASASTGIDVAAGSQACNQVGVVDQTAISIFAVTTGHAWKGFEVQ